ncbi:MAG: hypothetical protein HFI78_09385 [Lachnospiraceae bacterium]|jgi:hypothetical protein|nr:hypothetical protein [Lachnospiraceae bacterium]
MGGVKSVQGTGFQVGQSGIYQGGDPVSKQIQRQIADAKKQLTDIASNKEMGMEEKAKKRQELQKLIGDLNNQLRQHQIEQRRAAVNQEGNKEKKDSSLEEMLGKSKKNRDKKEGDKKQGFSEARMEAIISADSSMKMAKVQGDVSEKMENKVAVLESEIKLDDGRGEGTERKREEADHLEKRAYQAADFQFSTLEEANNKMQEADKKEKEETETENRKLLDPEKKGDQSQMEYGTIDILL